MLPPENDSFLWYTNASGALGLGLGPYPGVSPGPGAEAVVVPLVFGLIFVVGVVGNLLVVVVMCGLGRRGGARTPGHTPTTVFVLNLSAADLVFLLVCVPPQAAVYALPSWVLGGFLCSFAHYCASACTFVSIFTLAAVSVDRYLAVVRAGGSAACVRSRVRALTGVLVIWTAALVCAAPVARHQVLTGHPSAPNSSFCWESWSGESRRTYKVVVLVLGFLLPLGVICCCYCRVLCHLQKKMKTRSRKSRRSKKKTTLTVFLVVAAFTICWIPHHIIAMWVEFGSFPLNDATFAFRIVSHCLSYGNSCVNPVLYAFMSENFRKACRQVLGRRFLSTPPCDVPTAVRFRMDTFSTTHSTTTV